MAKLYPPYIEGTLPAFYLNKNGDGELVIPFAHNRALVSKEEISSFAIKIKSVQNDVLYGDVEVGANWEGNEVKFEVNKFKIAELEDLTFKIGQYYKIQIAYIDRTGIVGYYSTVGVVKCTSEPEVSIMNFDENKVNNNAAEFIGLFKQAEDGDVSEKVYSSKFIITDLEGNEVFSSGDILHSIENNPNSYESQDSVYFNRDLEYGEIYRIQYIVTTTNGLVISSPKYLLTQQKSIYMELKGKLVADLNYDEGFVDLKIEGAKNENGAEEIIDGLFIVSRADTLNPNVWEELTRFSLKHEYPSRTIFRDFTIEQGKTYTYSLQQYNANGIYSDRKKSNEIFADFEDMFLYDGERQLKLRFNPQVSSFKTQLAETKTDTIGSKYPFFFRNARVGYKTFPISGLVSMLSDDNQFFTSYKEILREDTKADRESTAAEYTKKLWPPIMDKNTDLVSDNFVSERLFKLKVLDWLNDGHVKLFKSPGEGNYLVRLMDNSLTPNTQVGRMLHTVNATAYECAELNYKNLIDNRIVREVQLRDEDTYVPSWRDFTLDNEWLNENTLKPVAAAKKGGMILGAYVSSPQLLSDINLLDTEDAPGASTTMLRFLDCLPGDRIRLVFDTSGAKEAKDHVDITIGATGNYMADDLRPVYGIYFLSDIGYGSDSNYNRSGFPSISYQYNIPNRTAFRSIEKIQADIGGYNQFVGEVPNLVKHLSYTREVPTKLCFSRYFKRPVEYLYYATDEIPNVISGENIYDGTYDYWGYRNLTEKYAYRLSWDVSTKHLSQEEREEKMRKYTFQKTKNTNGLNEDWWEVQDWARYYAQVQAFLNGVNPEDLSPEELEDLYYPKQWLMYYKSVDNDNLLPTYADVSAQIGGGNNSDRHIQMIIQKSDGSWTSHGSSCSHAYNWFLDSLEPGEVAYVWKPTLGDEEVAYHTDQDGNTIIDMSAYKGREESPEWFDDQESLQYSPFSLYVLRNQYITTLDGVRQNIFNHLPTSLPIEEKTHVVNHAFERYYIDRYINAQTPEEMLEERTLLAQQLAIDGDNEETAAVDAATALYVLDAWYGKVYEVGKDFMYDPSITYNNENIDLREIDRYELEALEPDETTIKVGNGVYGDVYYQKVEQTFSYEPEEYKNAWESAVAAAKTASPGYKEEAAERAAYKLLNDGIDAEREAWQKLRGEEEEV